jgi:hypothetical protein
MTRVGLKPKMVWVDIEPRKLFPWSASTVNNNAVINGVLARYRAAGLTVGIYSYVTAWKSITGNRALPGVPTWFPVGRKGYAEAMSRCGLASFAGSKPWLVQWTDGVRDYNRTCPGVTGQAARGNVLTPYLNVRLAVGSRGSAVAVLQRHLGGLKADGMFGPLTKAKVVALQRARHLPVNGVVTSAVWRALGASSGAYSPAVPGVMGTMFAST